MRTNRRACLGIAALLAGCAAPPPPPAPTAGIAIAPVTIANYDGTYRPPPEGLPGSVGCGTTRDHHALRVRDNVATMRTTGSGMITGPVYPDGSVDLEAGRYLLRGRIDGDSFTGVLRFGRCGYDVVYHRS